MRPEATSAKGLDLQTQTEVGAKALVVRSTVDVVCSKLGTSQSLWEISFFLKSWST